VKSRTDWRGRLVLVLVVAAAGGFVWLTRNPEQSELREGFASFLDAMAAGGTYAPEILRHDLGLPWEDLQVQWDSWVLTARI